MQRRLELKDRNKGFHNLGKTYNFKQTISNGEQQGDRIIPHSEDGIKFWSDIWSIRKEHNQHAEWLKDFREQFENVKNMDKVEINQEMVKILCRKMSKCS